MLCCRFRLQPGKLQCSQSVSVLTSPLLLQVGVSTAAALRAGPLLGVEGGEGGGGRLAGGVPLPLPHRGVEGRVVKDRDWRAGGLAEPRHVVQRDAGQ